MAWYRTGTLSLTNGSTSVTGSGTQFRLAGQAGDMITISGVIYEIDSINSDTSITLATAYAGTTASAITGWAIVQTQSRTKEMVDSVSTLVADVNGLTTSFAATGSSVTINVPLALNGSAAGAPINIAPGIAPSSPLNGDLWSTSSGLFTRTAGATQQLATVSQLGTYPALNSSPTFTGGAVTVAPATTYATITLAGVFSGGNSFTMRQGVVGVSNGGFSLRNETTGATPFVIENDGAARFGTTATMLGERFSVANSADTTGLFLNQLSTADCFSSIIRSGRASGATSAYMLAFFSADNGVVGTITSNGSSTSYNTTSDIRLKTNVHPAPPSGALIDAINVVSYDWKAGGSVYYGVIAQDLDEVFPAAVTVGDTETKVEKPWSVDLSKLVPLLIKEVQALRARVADLEGDGSSSPAS